MRPYDLKLDGRRLWMAFFLAVGIRVLFAFLIFPVITAESELLNTVADDYDKIAHNLTLGHGYVLSPGTAPTMQRLPLYPLFLAAFFSAFGPTTLWPIQLAQAVLDGFSCALVYVIAERVYRQRAVSQLAALLFAAYPGALVATARVVTEPLYTFLLLLAVMLYIVGTQAGKFAYVGLVGPVLGLAALCKSTGLLLPVYFGLMARRGGDWGRAVLRTTVVLGLGMTALLAPWIVRNYQLTGHFIPTSTIGGTVLYDGFYIVNHPDSGREFFELVDLSKQEQYRLLSSQGIQTYSGKYPFWFFSSADEYRWDRLMSRTVIEGLREAPGKLLRFLIDNAVGFWFLGRTRFASLISFALHLPFIVAAAIGVRRSSLEGRREAWLFLGVIVYFNLFYTVTLGMVRYAVPIIPFVAILAAKGLIDMYSWVKIGRSATVKTSLSEQLGGRGTAA